MKTKLGWLLVALSALGCGSSGTSGDEGTGGAGGSATSGSGSDGTCKPGSEVSCYDGPKATENIGICKAGKKTCKADGSGYGACEGEVLPHKEDCSTPEDDDCDGTANQPSAGCVCTPGKKESCYSGPKETEGVGLCKAGSHTCDASGKSWGPCDGEVLPKPEDCSTRGDENCDGIACSDAIWDLFAGDANEQEVDATAIDDANNTYAAGVFAGTMDLGGGPITAKGRDIFVAKFDPMGHLVWANDYGAKATSYGGVSSVSVDAAGHVLIAGGLSVPMTFGTTQLGAGSTYYGFLVNLDAQGNVQWAREFTTSTNEVGVDSAVFDAQGNVVATGSFSGTLTCAGGVCPVSKGGEDGFVEKLDASGTLIWTRTFGGKSDDYGGQVAVDANGNVIVIGVFQGTVKFLDGTSATSKGMDDIFVMKLDTNGNGVWTQALGSTQEDWAEMALRPDGSILMGGHAGGQLTLGSITTEASTTGAFVFALDASGQALWAHSYGVGEVGDTGVESLASDAAGNVVLAGIFDEGGSVNVTGTPVSNIEEAEDTFVVKLAPDGTQLWSKLFTGPGEQGFTKISMNSSGRSALGLSYQNTLDFGLGPSTSSNSEAGGDINTDIAIVNFQP